MKTQVYTVRVVYGNDTYLVGNFVGMTKARAFKSWAKKAGVYSAVIEPGNHSLVGPFDFASLFGSMSLRGIL